MCLIVYYLFAGKSVWDMNESCRRRLSSAVSDRSRPLGDDSKPRCWNEAIVSNPMVLKEASVFISNDQIESRGGS